MGLDAGDEMVDIVDVEDRVIEVVPRRIMRAQKLRHRAVFIAVFDGGGRLLIHRRSARKDVWSSWCDLAVGGVVGSGETYIDAAVRELAEEVGIAATDLRAIDQGEVRAYDDDQVSLLARCFAVATSETPTFNDGEVVEAWWVHRDGFDDLSTRERFLPDSLSLLLPLLDF